MSRSGSAALDETTSAGARAAERLRTEPVIWMTTVSPDGVPQTSPVWFLWDGDSFLVYSKSSPRVHNIEPSPAVSLNLDGNGQGGDIVVVEAEATIDESVVAVPENAEYLSKYGERMDRNGWSPEWFASQYSVPIVIRPIRYRVW